MVTRRTTVCAARLQLPGKTLVSPHEGRTTAHVALWGIYTHPITTCSTRATSCNTHGRTSKQSEHTVTLNNITPREGTAHSCELSYIGRLPRYVRSLDAGGIPLSSCIPHWKYITRWPYIPVWLFITRWSLTQRLSFIQTWPFAPTSVDCPSLVGGPIMALYQTSVVYHTRVVYPAPCVDLSVLDQSFRRRRMFGVRLSASPVSA